MRKPAGGGTGADVAAHNNLAAQWTVAGLAATTAVSRAAFARRLAS